MVGNSASGKSTLAQLLSAKYRLPLWHIDRIFWKAGWQLCEAEEFASVHKRWIAETHWLIDGIGHWVQLCQRLAACDVIIFLNTPIECCFERAAQRMAADAIAPNKFMADGCRYSDVMDRQQQVILNFESEMRPRLAQLLQEELSEKPQVILDGRRTPKELLTDYAEWLTAEDK